MSSEHLPARQRPIVIFDLDRTITRQGTFSPFLIYCLLRRRPWRLLLVPVIVVAMLGYVAKFYTRKTLKQRMQALTIAGLSRADLETLGHGFVTKTIAGGCFADALATIKQHKNAGDCLVIATASMDFYAEIFAHHLGFDHAIGTRATWTADGRLKSEIAGDNCYGPAKLDRVREFLATLGADGYAVAYSDHKSDLPFLKAADRGVVVNGKPKALVLADQHGFEKVTWR